MVAQKALTQIRMFYRWLLEPPQTVTDQAKSLDLVQTLHPHRYQASRHGAFDRRAKSSVACNFILCSVGCGFNEHVPASHQVYRCLVILTSIVQLGIGFKGPLKGFSIFTSTC